MTDIVSIALCTFNGGRFLSEQLKSYLHQTRLPDELIVGDDGSSDATLLILEDFSKIAPFPVRIKVNDCRYGLVRNFDETINRCTGNIIFLSDQDDVWEDGKIKRIMDEFLAFPSVGLIFSDAALVTENLEYLSKTVFDRIFSAASKKLVESDKALKALFERNFVGGLTTAFRADYKKCISPIPTQFPKLLHDYWIALIIAAVSEIRFLPYPLVRYRQHADQESRVIWPSSAAEGKPPNESSTFDETVFNLSERRMELLCLRERLANGSCVGLDENRLQTSLKVVEDHIGNIETGIAHFKTRNMIRDATWNRFLIIGRELFSGRYTVYSNGLRSALKDLIVR